MSRYGCRKIGVETLKLDIMIGTVSKDGNAQDTEKLVRLGIDLMSTMKHAVEVVAPGWTPPKVVEKQNSVLVDLGHRIVGRIEGQGILLAAAARGHPALLILHQHAMQGNPVG